MRSLFFKGFIFSSLVFLSSAFCSSQSLSPKREALQKQLATLQEEKAQAELLARFADREAYRVMPIDWSSYHRYLDVQAHAQARAEALDLQCKLVEKELQALPQ